ncbi:MAG: hypothetical protein P8184_16285 [Calditrichia bacterium]
MRTQRSFNRFVLFWLNLLPLLFLAATFEHCYVILKDYSDTLTLAGVNVSTVSKMLLVIAIDASLVFISQARTRQRKNRAALEVRGPGKPHLAPDSRFHAMRTIDNVFSKSKQPEKSGKPKIIQI